MVALIYINTNSMVAKQVFTFLILVILSLSCQKSTDFTTVALIGNKKITQEEISSKISSELYDLKLREYNLYLKVVRELLFEELLRLESAQTGKEIVALKNENIDSKTLNIPEEVLREYYEKNKAKITQPYSSANEHIRKMFSSQLRSNLKKAYFEKLKSKHSAKITLKKPIKPLLHRTTR